MMGQTGRDTGNEEGAGYSKAVGDPPGSLMAGFSSRVFEKTTRSDSAFAAQGRRRLLLGTLSGAAAAVAGGVVLWPEKKRFDGEAAEFAEVDLELLGNIELCRDLELLEVLEAAEEFENG